MEGSPFWTEPGFLNTEEFLNTRVFGALGDLTNDDFVRSPVTRVWTDNPGAIAVLNIIGNKTDSMTTYIINYKEYGRGWSRTTYTTPETVTREYLISFFGLEECEDYNIEETTN